MNDQRQGPDTAETDVLQSEAAVTGIRHERMPTLCRICSAKISVREREEEWPELRDGSLCDLCYRGARDVFRDGPCHLCGRQAMCKAVVGGLVCVQCYAGQPALERYDRCVCGRLDVLQIADRIGRRYLCVRCSENEEMATLKVRGGKTAKTTS